MSEEISAPELVRLNDIHRRLRAAKSRALYWSGNPSFSKHRFKPNTDGRGKRFLGGPNDQYELALADIANLSTLIEEITGKRLKRYDPRKAFQARFSAKWPR